MKWCIKYIQEAHWPHFCAQKTGRGYESWFVKLPYNIYGRNEQEAMCFSDINEAYKCVSQLPQDITTIGNRYWYVVEEMS